jgi:hypothetical protein
MTKKLGGQGEKKTIEEIVIMERLGDFGVPLRVGLSAASPRAIIPMFLLLIHCAAGFSLLSLTQVVESF